jgi:raffinose/stachyose/melibiose transport system substrate-binding protein
MKEKNLFFLTGLLVAILVVILITGCNNTGTAVTMEAETTKALKTTTAETKEAEEDLSAVTGTLKISSFRPEETNFNNKVTEIFNEKYPNVEVVFDYPPHDQYLELMQSAFVAGEGAPDIFLAWAHSTSLPLYESGAMLDLTGWELTEIVPEAAKAQMNAVFGGIEAGIPLAQHSSMVFYNLDLFKENNLEVPKSYDELLEVSKAFLKKGISPIQNASKDLWSMSHIYGVFEAKYRANPTDNWYECLDTEFKPANEQMKYVWDEGYLDNASMGFGWQQVLDNFAAGRFPIFPGYTYNYDGFMAAQPQFELGIEAFPNNDAGDLPRSCVFYDNMWSINRDSENIDLAKEWITLCLDNYQLLIQQTKWLPIYPTSAIEEIDPNLKLMSDTLESSEKLVFADILHNFSPKLVGDYQSNLQKYLMGDIDLDTLASMMADVYSSETK